MTFNLQRMGDTRKRAFMKKRRCRVFADGREIHSVWYYDGRRKIVKTYDVREDGTLATSTRGCPFPIDPSWDAPLDGVLSKTIYAKRVHVERIRD